MSLGLALALALQAAAPAREPVWVSAGPAPGATAEYDAANIVALDGARRRVRVRAVYHRIRPDGVASSIAVGEIDCADRTAMLIEMQDLDATGNVLATRTIPNEERRAMPSTPGGPEEAGLMRICASPAA